MFQLFVISNVELKKRAYFRPTLRPNVSFLDPTNTFSVNAYQTASGSADIMAHVFDGHISLIRKKWICSPVCRRRC
ncbi:MAG: iron-containing alcohol dehydrogenase [Ruminococcus bicirculans (ex Wegman et al. 2014)]